MHDCDVSGSLVRAKASPVTLHTDSLQTEKLRMNKIFSCEDKIAIANVNHVKPSVWRNTGDRVNLDIVELMSK